MKPYFEQISKFDWYDFELSYIKNPRKVFYKPFESLVDFSAVVLSIFILPLYALAMAVFMLLEAVFTLHVFMRLDLLFFNLALMILGAPLKLVELFCRLVSTAVREGMDFTQEQDTTEDLRGILSEMGEETGRIREEVIVVRLALAQYLEDASAVCNQYSRASRENPQEPHQLERSRVRDERIPLLGELLGSYPSFPEEANAINLRRFYDERTRHHDNVLALAEALIPDLHAELRAIETELALNANTAMP